MVLSKDGIPVKGSLFLNLCNPDKSYESNCKNMHGDVIIYFKPIDSTDCIKILSNSLNKTDYYF